MSDTPRALFATDLDGTLVDRHDTIEPGDREAIARAEREGVRVTIATGRLTSRTLPVAKALGLKSPLVCADGGVIVCGETERVLSRRHIGRREVETILETFVRHGLSSFVFTHAAIHGCARGKDLHGYVSGWAYDITTHGDILAADAWRSDPHATVMLVGIGPEHGARGAEDHLEGAAPELERLSFELAGRRVIRWRGGG